MTLERITEIISSQIQIVLDGQESEYPKLDFKRQWYDLHEELSINEFLKDSTAMANAPGLDGFIVIGFDQKDKSFHPAKFSDSKLRDENELSGLINKRVDRLFHISHYPLIVNGNTISVLHIPPSFDKPHVIRNYKTKNSGDQQHRVFTKSGSSTKLATKYDYDFIAFDRANHIPEYDLQISFSKLSYTVDYNKIESNVNLKLTMAIENTGRRAVSIHEIVLDFDSSLENHFKFISTSRPGNNYNSLIKVTNLVILPGHIELIPEFSFTSTEKFADSVVDYLQKLSLFKEITAIAKLNSGSEVKTRVQIID